MLNLNNKPMFKRTVQRFVLWLLYHRQEQEWKELQAQVEFWHQEETRLLSLTQKAYREGQRHTHKKLQKQLAVCQRRRKREVTDKL